MTTLYFKDNVSDKVYEVWVEEAPIGWWNVNYAYGRRGSTLTTGVKNSIPLRACDAMKMMDKLLREKLAKGYTQGENGAAYKATDKEDRFTGILPMLLNAIEEDEVAGYIHSISWVAQQKFDGVRMSLNVSCLGNVMAVNRKGLKIGAPQAILDECAKLPGEFTLDGECIGDTFHAFDIINEFEPLYSRLNSLYDLLDQTHRKHIVQVETQFSCAGKQNLMARLKDMGAEGIVFKHYNGMYRAGRPASGGNALKFKFYKTLSAVVCHINEQRSVAILVYKPHDNDNEFFDGIQIGNVTIPPNQDIPNFGDVVEVRYLYANKNSDHLYQPVYLGKRVDLWHGDCRYSQLKFKNEEDES
jgi:bifunctional non-homologous end joining protein LigD